MFVLHDGDVARARLRVVMTERDDGDVHPGRVARDVLVERQRRVTGVAWAMADQVHGCEVWHVDADTGDTGDTGDTDGGSAVAFPPADVICSSRVPVAVWSADCATLLLATRRHRLIGVHAGWRGLAAGVIDVAVAVARDVVDAPVAGADEIDLVVAGPTIGPCCYEFGPDDLGAVAAGVGAPVERLVARTAGGAPALDVRAALRAALANHGLAVDIGVDECTGCSDRWWSHRAGLDIERQALVGWWA